MSMATVMDVETRDQITRILVSDLEPGLGEDYMRRDDSIEDRSNLKAVIDPRSCIPDLVDDLAIQ